MRIAALSSPTLVNSNYRSYQPMGVLARRGHEVQHNREDQPIRAEALLKVDVVHVHRIANPEMLSLLESARNAGVGIVWDNDDDVTAVPRTNPLYAKHGGFKSRERLAELRAAMQLADVVTTPSAVLAEQYRGLGAGDVRVLENFMPSEFTRVRPAKHDGIVIAYLAALEHQVDYQQLGLRDTFGRLLEAHPELRVMSIGLGLGLRHERYEHCKETVPFLELAKVLSRADVGVAPLVDIPWNRARSNVKLKEYASAGLPWLASPVGPYLGMGEGQGGRLVRDSEWYEQLERLIVGDRERRKLAKRAAKWVKGEGVEDNAQLWERAVKDAAERARSRGGAALTARNG